MLRSSLSRSRRDEEGSIILAVTVMMVVTLLIVATLSLTESGLTSARTDQNRTNAFQFANAGMDQALYRIDGRVLPSTALGNYSPTVTNGEVSGFTDRVTVGAAEFNIIATQNPVGQSTTWKVRALGKDPSGRLRQAIADITSTPLFLNGFFTVNDFSLTGNQTTPLAYRSSTCPTAAVSCQIAPVPGTIGTNSTFSGSGVTHFASNWIGFNMYGRATQAAAEAACSDCPASQVFAITDQLKITVPAQPSGATCPANASGVITGTLAPGDYACDGEVTLGEITVGGVASGVVRLWVNGNVKLGQSGGGGIVGSVNRQKATKKFQLFVPEKPGGGTWPWSPNSGFCRGEFWGLLYAPGLTLECNGSHQPEIYGSVVAHMNLGTGNHFGFHWDLDAINALNDGKFVVKNWRECPPTATDC